MSDLFMTTSPGAFDMSSLITEGALPLAITRGRKLGMLTITRLKFISEPGSRRDLSRAKKFAFCLENFWN